ncbi:hypothetical protein LMG28138_01146 [Pararobbsia alpina]|uniref:Uncharacterized protein n=1 Tax=Pararobbsia alpina TaxID=621374 RepID=A0A6S7CJ03_9BURK|nr:hypothetical protein LMG28138_01146 [Pararobbsia alpina]
MPPPTASPTPARDHRLATVVRPAYDLIPQNIVRRESRCQRRLVRRPAMGRRRHSSVPVRPQTRTRKPTPTLILRTPTDVFSDRLPNQPFAFESYKPSVPCNRNLTRRRFVAAPDARRRDLDCLQQLRANFGGEFLKPVRFRGNASMRKQWRARPVWNDMKVDVGYRLPAVNGGFSFRIKKLPSRLFPSCLPCGTTSMTYCAGRAALTRAPSIPLRVPRATGHRRPCAASRCRPPYGCR